FQAFTFGVAKVGLPAGCEAFVSGRDVVIVASTDKAGLEHAKVKADLAQQVAKSVRVVTAFEVLEGDEVTCIPTATSEPEPGRIHNVSLVPAMPEVDMYHATSPYERGRRVTGGGSGRPLTTTESRQAIDAAERPRRQWPRRLNQRAYE